MQRCERNADPAGFEAQVHRRALQQFAGHRRLGHTQDGEHGAAHLPVRPVPGLPLGCVGGRRFAGGEPRAGAAHGALTAFGGPGGADQRPQFHHGGVPAHGGCAVVGQQLCGEPHFARRQGRGRQRGAGDEPGVDPADVGVHHRLPLAEGKRCDGSRRVAADAGELEQLRVAARDLATVVVHDRDGGRVQPQGPPRIPQPAPGPDRLAGGLAGQIGRGGPAPEPFFPDRQHPDHGGLLKHDFADQHTPGGAVLRAPRKIPGRFVEPAVEGSVQLGERNRRGGREGGGIG